MKIVMVSKEFPPSPHSYGIGTYTYETSIALSRLGHKLTLICAADAAPAGESLVNNVQIIRLPDREFRPRSIRAHIIPPVAVVAYRRRVAEMLDRLIADGDADIVEFAGYRGESFVWAAQPRRIPMVVRMHGFTGWVDKTPRDYISAARRQMMRYETLELLRADRITLVADHLREIIEKRISRVKVTTLHNGIDALKWAPDNTGNGCLNINSNDIVFVGSLSGVKGIFTLLEAAEKLYQSGLWRGRLVLFGRSTKEFENYKKKHWGNRNSHPSYLDIRGSVSRDLLAQVYRSAGVCCFPSFREPFNYTALEATASGGLVVGSYGTGMQEMIVHRETGFLLAPGDPERLSAMLTYVLHLRKVRSDEIRAAARHRTLSLFDQSVITQRLEALYSSEIQAFSQNIRSHTASIDLLPPADNESSLQLGS